MVRRVLIVGALALAALAVAGCYGRIYARPGVSGVVVYDPPPPPPAVMVTTPPPAPYHGAVWVQGHWSWNGAQYVWVQGHYIQPRADYVYVQPRWTRRGNGWVYVQGTWRPHAQGRARVHVNRPRVRARGNVEVR